MNKRLAIIGASALGRQIAHQAFLCAEAWSVAGFFDDFSVIGGDVIGAVDDVQKVYDEGGFDALAIGVGYNAMSFRSASAERFYNRIPLARIVSREAFVDPTAKIEEGAVILAGTLIDQKVKIGLNNFLSLGCSVSHETVIGANTYFAPRVTICGRCHIGRNCFLGAGCIIRDGVSIADNVTVGAGAVVVKDIENQGVYVGCPAKKLDS